jgi:hypothetical protein
MSFPCGVDNLFSNCQFFGKSERSALDLVACQAAAALPAGGTWHFNFWTAFCDGPNVFAYCLPPAETILILKLVEQTGRFLEKKVTMKMLLFLGRSRMSARSELEMMKFFWEDRGLDRRRVCIYKDVRLWHEFCPEFIGITAQSICMRFFALYRNALQCTAKIV